LGGEKIFREGKASNVSDLVQLLDRHNTEIELNNNDMKVTASVFSNNTPITEIELSPTSTSMQTNYLLLAEIESNQLKDSEIKVVYTAKICDWAATTEVFNDCFSSYESNWQWVNPTLTGNSIRSIWGTDINNVYAVGNSGTLLHYDGISWRKLKTLTINNLRKILGFSRNSIFAIGDEGTILSYNGIEWKKMPTITTGHFTNICGTSESNIFIKSKCYSCDNTHTLYHFDGLTWSSVPLPESFVDNEGSNKSFSIKQIDNITYLYSDKEIYMYVNSEWTYFFPDFAITANFSIQDISGESIDNTYILVGEEFNRSNTNIYHFDGNHFTIPFEQVTTTIEGFESQHYCWEIFVSQDSLYLQSGFIESSTTYRYNGTNWEKLFSSPAEEHSVFIKDDKVFISNSAEIYIYDGQETKKMTSNVLDNLYENLYNFKGIWSSSEDNKYIVFKKHSFQVENGFGGLLHYDGNNWEEVVTGCAKGNDFIWGSNNDHVYIAGEECDDNVYALEGQDLSFMPVSIHCTPERDHISDIWVDSSNKIFMSSNHVVFKNTCLNSNYLYENNSERIESIWGDNIDNLYAVGYQIIQISNTISEIPLPDATSPHDHLRSIYGISKNSIISVGYSKEERYYIVHYDGNTWTKENAPDPKYSNWYKSSSHLYGVWGCQENEKEHYFACGSYGGILHRYDNKWVAEYSGTNNSLNSIHGSSIFDVYAVGSNSTILKYCPAIIMIGDAKSSSGAKFSVPISLKNTHMFPIRGVKLQILFDQEILKFSGATLEKSVLEGKNYQIISNVKNNDTVIISIAEMGSGDYYIGNGVIALLSFEVTNSQKNYSDFQFLEAKLNENEICTEYGRFYRQDPLSGRILNYATSAPVPNVQMLLNGRQVYQTTSDENGRYTFNSANSGEYEIFASKSDDLSGLGAPDATSILLASVEKIDYSCYQMVAADVTGNGEIDPTDASDLANYVAGNRSCLNKNCRHWAFIPKTEKIDCAAWSESKINYNESKSITLPPYTTNNDFVAIRLGHVFNVPNIQTSLTRKKIKKLNDLNYITINNGDTFTIPIVLEEPAEIWGIDIKISYEAEKLSLKSINHSGGILKDYILTQNIDENNVITLLLYTANEIITGHGLIANLEFTVISEIGSPVIQFEKFDVNKVNANGGFKVNNRLSSKFFVNIGGILGDIDYNNKIDIKDVILGLKILAGMSNEQSYPISDVNQDFTFGIGDIILLIHNISDQ